MIKQCTKCKKYKTLENFHSSKVTKDKLKIWCKTCCNKYTIEWKKNNPNYNKEYYKSNSKIIKETRRRKYKKNPGNISKFNRY
jgi:hypothetical protein